MVLNASFSPSFIVLCPFEGTRLGQALSFWEYVCTAYRIFRSITLKSSIFTMYVCTNVFQFINSSLRRLASSLAK
jgi:hypothetical protein